jgi:hypothetical protein
MCWNGLVGLDRVLLVFGIAISDMASTISGTYMRAVVGGWTEHEHETDMRSDP